MLSSRLLLGLPNWCFSKYFSTKVLCAFLFSPSYPYIQSSVAFWIIRGPVYKFLINNKNVMKVLLVPAQGQS
jgi:hypothetical protein